MNCIFNESGIWTGSFSYKVNQAIVKKFLCKYAVIKLIKQLSFLKIKKKKTNLQEETEEAVSIS